MCDGEEVPGEVLKAGFNKIHLPLGSRQYGYVTIRALHLVGLNP